MIANFREAVRACNLIDVGYKGYPFTWLNRRYGENFIEERLDIFFCSGNWNCNFQVLAAINLISWVSDHCPMVLEVKERESKGKHNRRTFSRDHYEDMWSSYEGCQNIVKEKWGKYGERVQEDPMESFQRTYKSSLAQLKWWSKEEFGDRQRKQNKLIQQLQNIKQNPSRLANGDEIRRIESKLSNILIDEEICWKQRSRADWLKERDKNMKIFHAKASARKRKNKIQGIEDSHERARQRTKKR